MEIHKALDQISVIHEHLAKAEVYRHYRALPVSLSGALALVAAAMQYVFIGDATPRAFITYWICVAAPCALVAGGGIVQGYLRADRAARRKTRVVVGQFLPCLIAGILITFILMSIDGNTLALLPGLWAVLFSLGIFSSRPYLPRAIGFSGLYYLVAGIALLISTKAGQSLSAWGIGLTFGVGQIIAGLILYWNLERGEIE